MKYLIRFFLVTFALINLLMASDDLRPEESSAVIDRTAGKLAGQPRFVEYLHDHKSVLNQKVFENNPTRISTFWGGLEQVSLTGITSLEVVQGLLLFALSRDLDPYDAEHKSTTEFMDVVFRSEVRIIDALVRCKNFAQCIHTINDFFRKTTRKDNNGRRQQESHHAERLDQVPSEYYGIDEQSRRTIEEEIKKRIGLLFVPGVSTLSVDKPYDMLQNLFHGIATINLGVVHAHGMKFYPLASFIHDLFHYHDLRDTHRDALTMLIKQRIGFKRQTTDTVVELALDQSFQEIMREYQVFCDNLSGFLERYKTDRMCLTALFEMFHEGELRRSGNCAWHHIGSLRKFFTVFLEHAVRNRGNRGNDEYESADTLVTHTGKSSLPDEELRQIALSKILQNYTGFNVDRFILNIVQTDNFVLVHFSHPQIYGERTKILGRILRSKLDNAYDLWRLLGGYASGLQDPKAISSVEEASKFLDGVYEKRQESFGHLTGLIYREFQTPQLDS